MTQYTVYTSAVCGQYRVLSIDHLLCRCGWQEGVRPYELKIKSVRANPEIGSIPISEVSGHWTSEFRSFCTLSPFRLLASVCYNVWNIECLENRWGEYVRKWLNLLKIDDNSWQSKKNLAVVSIHVPKRKRVRKLPNSEVQRPQDFRYRKTAEFGVCPNWTFMVSWCFFQTPFLPASCFLTHCHWLPKFA